MRSRARWLGGSCFVLGLALALWSLRADGASKAEGIGPPEPAPISAGRRAEADLARPVQARRTDVPPMEADAAVPGAEDEQAPIVLRVVIETTSGRGLGDALRELFDPYSFDVNVIATLEEPPALLAYNELMVWGVAGGFRELDPVEHEGPAIHGTLWLSRPSPLHVSLVLGQGVVATQFAPQGTEEVILTIPDDDLGALCGSFQVQYAREDPALPLVGSVFVETGHSTSSISMSKQGKYRRDHIPPGRVRVQLLAQDAEPWEKSFDVAAGQHVDLGDVTLREGAAITGRVQLAGAGTAGVALELAPVPSSRGPWLPLQWEPVGRSQEDGSFRIGWKPQGRYLLRAVPRSLPSATGEEWLVTSPVLLVDTRGGARAGIALLLEEACEVALPRPVEGSRAVWFLVLDADANMVHRGHLPRDDSFVHLVQGNYTVVFHDTEKEITRREVKVTRGMRYLGDAR